MKKFVLALVVALFAAPSFVAAQDNNMGGQQQPEAAAPAQPEAKPVKKAPKKHKAWKKHKIMKHKAVKHKAVKHKKAAEKPAEPAPAAAPAANPQ